MIGRLAEPVVLLGGITDNGQAKKAYCKALTNLFLSAIDWTNL